MNGINKYTVSNAIATKDSQLQFIPSGAAKLNVWFAVNTSYKSKKTQKYEQESIYLRGELWGDIAKTMAEMIKKGTKFDFEGVPKQNSFEKDGKKILETYIRLQSVYIDSPGKSNKSNKNENNNKNDASNSAQNNNEDYGDDFTDDDVPF